MRAVSIVGVGQTPAQCQGAEGRSDLAAVSIRQALADSAPFRPQALYLSTMCAEGGAQQATAAAQAAGVAHSDIRLVAAACGGGAALHVAVQAIAAGVFDYVVVTGVAAAPGEQRAASLDATLGLPCGALDALILRRYLYEYSWRRDDLAPFVITARANALGNPHAAMRSAVSEEQYHRARVLAQPLAELDCAPQCTGAASVALCAAEMAQNRSRRPVRVAASSVGREALALHDRANVLWLQGVYDSARAAYAQAGLMAADIDLFELHDASTIMAALSLEAAGFADRGMGVRLALDGAIGLRGSIPISTLGGLLGRGDVGGASGVYQAVEAVQQLRGAAGANQIDGVRVAMTQSTSGNGACVATHILQV